MFRAEHRISTSASVMAPSQFLYICPSPSRQGLFPLSRLPLYSSMLLLFPSIPLFCPIRAFSLTSISMHAHVHSPTVRRRFAPRVMHLRPSGRLAPKSFKQTQPERGMDRNGSSAQIRSSGGFVHTDSKQAVHEGHHTCIGRVCK